MKLNQNLREIVFGGLLGDLNLQTYTKGASWRLRQLQTLKYEPYVVHLHNCFSPWVKTGVCYTTNRPHIVTEVAYSKAYFNTVTIPDLAQFGELFLNLIFAEGKTYPKHQKHVPEVKILEEWLTPKALAYWYMDDGSYKGSVNSARFCTDGFTYNEVESLVQVLRDRYGFICTIIKDGPSWRIGNSTKSFSDFSDLVKPHIIPTMMYKLGL